MRKVTTGLDLLGLTGLFALFLVIILASLTQDTLLFRSDLLTLLRFLASLALLGLLALSPIPLLCLWLSPAGHCRRLSRVLSILVMAEILFGFSIHLLDRSLVFNYLLKILPVPRPPAESSAYHDGRTLLGFALLATGLFVVCAALSFLASLRIDLADRLRSLGRLNFVVSAALVLSFPLYEKFQAITGAKAASGRNIVLIVLDGLSTRYLGAYGTGVETPAFDDLAAKGLLFTNVRTNMTYTHGFFYTLYSGRKNVWAGKSTKSRESMVSVLQEEGVNFRWMTYHNNGVPDTHHLPYRGLRSTFLSFPTARLVRHLGLDYHVFVRAGPGGRGKSMGYRERVLYEWLLKVQGEYPSHPLENRVMEEIAHLRKDRRPHFAVIHLPTHAYAMDEYEPPLWEIEQLGRQSGDRLREVQHAILTEQGYRYDESQEWAVTAMEKSYFRNVLAGTQSLGLFVEKMEAAGWNRDTEIIVTADHGSIYARGKMAYGYHNDEEVTRVPFLVIGNDRGGVDDRLGETIDIARTILDLCGVDSPSGNSAVALLADGGKRKELTTSLTYSSLRKEEWFLNVYRGDGRFVINIYPGHFRYQREVFEDYYRTSPVDGETSDGADPPFPWLDLLREYGIEGDPRDNVGYYDMVH